MAINKITTNSTNKRITNNYILELLWIAKNNLGQNNL